MRLWFLLIGLLLASPAFGQTQFPGQVPPTQCVSSAAAQGTADAITIAQLPCIPTTTLLLLTTRATNVGANPTLAVGSGPPQIILNFDGSPIGPGFFAANQHRQLTNNGFNWFVLNGGGGGGGGGISLSAGPCAEISPSPITFSGTISTEADFPVPCGGTGRDTLTAHYTLVGNDASQVSLVAPSTAGYVYTSNGASTDPSFQPINPIDCNSLLTGCPFSIPVSWSGVPPASTNIRVDMVESVSCAANLPGSKADAKVAATGSTTVTIKQYSGGVGTSRGSVNWAASATVGTFTAAASFTLLAGDAIEFGFQNPADATLSDPAITLQCIRLTGAASPTSLPALTHNHIFVGSALSVATDVAMSGSCTIADTGVITCTAGGLTVGTSPIASGTTGRVLYDNAGVLGEMTTSGSGTQLALATSPTIASLTVTGALTATGLVTNADLVNQATTVNGQTCTLGSTCTITAAATGITVGTTTVGSGTTTRVLFDNAGTLGEYSISGTGNVVMNTSPSISGLTVTSSFTATGLVTNADLANSATTVNGQTCTLGSTCTVTATATAITVGTTTVGSGTSAYGLYNNAGTLGNLIRTCAGWLTDSGTACTAATGTSGATLPFLNGNNTWSKAQAVTPVALTPGAGTIAVDGSLSNGFTLTTGNDNNTLGNPTNLIAGQLLNFQITVGSGGHTGFATGTNYKYASGTAPTWSTAAAKIDVISCWAVTTSVLECSAMIDVH